MGTTITAYQFTAPKEPLKKVEYEAPALEEGQALVEVAGCGVCHTDLGFYYDGVPMKHELPLTLGHEISGRVLDAKGAKVEKFKNKRVLIPAVIPCGECALCKAGRGNICRTQVMPGNDMNGGFASHIVIPGHWLCEIDDKAGNDWRDAPVGKAGVPLWQLSVVADAATTPYQALVKAGAKEGDFCIFNGVGGIGGYGVQVAKAMGCKVAALDIDDAKLDMMKKVGADFTFNVKGKDLKELKGALKEFTKSAGISPFCWKILETSGTAAGQETAFGLMSFGATLSIVGFTLDKVKVRLSNMMAFDSSIHGNWGCDPALYPDVLKMVTDGKIKLDGFVKKFPLEQINEVFEMVHGRKLVERAVMAP